MKISKQQLSKYSGLSMVEVLVAIFIISIGVILFGYFATSLKTTSDARLETEAMTTLRSALDATRAKWSDENIYSIGELPFSINAPNGYTNLAVGFESIEVVKSGFSVSNDHFGLVCMYDYSAETKKFNNNCDTLDPKDDSSFIRQIEFQLSGPDRETLRLNMDLSRPIQ